MLLSVRTAWGWLLVAAAAFGACRVASPAKPDPNRPTVGWESYAGNGGQRWSPLQELTPATVRGLRPVWRWRVAEQAIIGPAGGLLARPFRFEATPLVFGDTLYVVTPLHQAVALDARTGRELWRFDADTWRQANVRTRVMVTHRGLSAWADPGGRRGRRLFLTSGSWLFAIDAATGRPIADFGAAGRVDLAAGLPRPVDPAHFGQTSPPAILDSLVIVGSSVSDEVTYPSDPPGDVQAFHVVTGAPVWRWSPIPGPNEPGGATWPPNAAAVAGHTNVWASITVDSARNLVFLPVSTPSNDWYGGERPGDNLYAESLVCLDGATGKRRWHFQIVHHGLWDYDLAAQPTLIQVERDGQLLDAVAIAGKTGFVYAFERETGTPLWPIEERPVLASTVPGERPSPTQPFPSKPAPFARQGFSLDDVVDFTPAIRAAAMAELASRRLGPLFTPPSLEGTVVSPGWIGGAGWGSVAFDPRTRTLFVKATNRPTLSRLVVPDPEQNGLEARFIMDPAVSLRGGYHLRIPLDPAGGPKARPLELPLGKPPYGTLTAIDMDSGDHRWQIVLGDTPSIRNHPLLRDLRLPPLGVAGAPGPIVTAGGLLFITGGGRALLALDAVTGATVASADLDREAFSVPTAYRASNGRVYVAVASGQGRNAELVVFTVDLR